MLGPLLASIQLAEFHHRTQLDKGGQPYLGHVVRVVCNTLVVAKQDGMSEGEAMVACMVAALHDTVEDTAASLGDVSVFAMTTLPDKAALALVDAVDAITHRDGESYDAYLGRVERNRFARVVKIADLTDNMSPERVLPDEAWQSRAMLRYRAAFDRITGGETSMAQLLNAIQPKD